MKPNNLQKRDNLQVVNPPPPVYLAKISQPNPGSYFPRQNLFAQLDAALGKKLIWVSGLAGSGKTTLASSYIEERRIPSLWYQLDEGDADIASFFYYLKIAAENKITGLKNDLPLFTAEYFSGIEAFSRNFFRRLYAVMPAPQIIVFDNFQDLPADEKIKDIINLAYSELPDGFVIICLSRNEPPSEFTRHFMYGKFDHISGQNLALSQQESYALAQHLQYDQLEEAVVLKLYKLTQGWLAGLILLFEHTNRVPDGAQFAGTDSHKLLFDFFAGEIFSRLKKDSQNFLLKTAFLPNITVTSAKKITGSPRADHLLNYIVNKNYFIQRLQQDSVSYHPLFREFLIATAADFFEPEELDNIKQNAAKILIDENSIIEGASLLIQTKNWNALCQLIIKNSSNLISTGQYITLQNWFKKIPSDIIESSPWLLFWQGASCQPFNILQCRSLFKKAYLSFKDKEDYTGAFLSWSGFVDTFQYLYDDFSVLDYWVDELYDLQKSCPRFPNAETEFRVAGGVFSALMWCSPDSPEIDYWLEKAEQIIHLKLNPSYRMRVGNNLLLYTLWWRGDFAKAKILMEHIQKVVDEAPVEPLVQLTWKIAEAAYFAMVSRHEDCINAVKDGCVLAHITGIHIAYKGLYLQGVYGCLAINDLECAADFLEKSLDASIKIAHFDMAHLYYLSAWVAICRNDFISAKKYIELSVKKALLCGASMALPWTHHTLGQIQIETGAFAEAKKNIDKAWNWANAVKNAILQHHCLLSLAYCAMKSGNKRGLTKHLKAALQLGREQGYISHPWIGWRSDVMAQLYMQALQLDIETDYVCMLIKERKIIPKEPPLTIENWPWPIKIYTLGRFSLVIDGKAVQQSRKGQKKPLELLKALIALGGREISTEKLSDALWPDAEGDSAHGSLTTTLHRLRKLLVYDDAVRLSEGLVSLDARYCWVDAWVLERKLKEVDELKKRKNDRTAISNAVQNLYRGDFLARESDYFWVLSMRERLRSLFLKSLLSLGHEFAKNRQYAKALQIYQKGVEVDDLSEDFYKNIMITNAIQGNIAEAVRWYDKCRMKLENVLQSPPSHETNKILHAIKNDDVNSLSKLNVIPL